MPVPFRKGPGHKERIAFGIVETSRQVILWTELVVQPDSELVDVALVRDVPAPIVQLADRRLVWQRHKRKDRCRPRIDPVRRNLVSLKRLLRLRIDDRRKTREVSAAPQLIWNRRTNKRRRPLTQPFVVPEEECPVLDDPSANRKAEFVAGKRRLRHSGLIGIV